MNKYYKLDDEKLLQLGYNPSIMTIKEKHEALYGKIKGPSIFDILGIPPEEIEKIKPSKDRYAKRYLPVNLIESNEILTPTYMNFWVGVQKGLYESKPIIRYMTNCYSSCKVYIFGKLLAFRSPNKQYYVIPKCEYWAIQGDEIDKRYYEVI